MAKNKSSNQPDNAPEDKTILTDESLEQVSGGGHSPNSHGQGKAKGQDKTSVNNLKQLPIDSNSNNILPFIEQ